VCSALSGVLLACARVAEALCVERVTEHKDPSPDAPPALTSAHSAAQQRKCCAIECRKLGKKLCSRCENAHYCDAGCQKAHWRTHKPVCTLPLQAVEARLQVIYGPRNSRGPHTNTPHPRSLPSTCEKRTAHDCGDGKESKESADERAAEEAEADEALAGRVMMACTRVAAYPRLVTVAFLTHADTKLLAIDAAFAAGYLRALSRAELRRLVTAQYDDNERRRETLTRMQDELADDSDSDALGA